MTTNWPEFTAELSDDLKSLRGGAPAAMKAYSAIAEAALAPNARDAKTKEPLALGIVVAVRCDDCIAFHVKAAVGHGASRDEIFGDARHGDLHGRGFLRHVCEPRPRRLWPFRRCQGRIAIEPSRHTGRPSIQRVGAWSLAHTSDPFATRLQ